MRAARGLLDWSQSELAAAAELSLPTVKRAERDRGAAVSQRALGAIVDALEKRGIEFIDENGGGAGVRLKKDASKRRGK